MPRSSGQGSPWSGCLDLSTGRRPTRSPPSQGSTSFSLPLPVPEHVSTLRGARNEVANRPSSGPIKTRVELNFRRCKDPTRFEAQGFAPRGRQGNMAAWNIGSRLWLFICNGSSLVLSIVLLVYGAVGAFLYLPPARDWFISGSSVSPLVCQSVVYPCLCVSCVHSAIV